MQTWTDFDTIHQQQMFWESPAVLIEAAFRMNAWFCRQHIDNRRT